MNASKKFIQEVNMPGRNRKGPTGNGPMTGRGQGLCLGNNSNSTMNRPGGMGAGKRHGRRNMYHKTGLPGYLRSFRNRETEEAFQEDDSFIMLTSEEKVIKLKQYAENLQKEISEINNQISEIQNNGENK
jgi:hypothetical protein